MVTITTGKGDDCGIHGDHGFIFISVGTSSMHNVVTIEIYKQLQKVAAF